LPIRACGDDLEWLADIVNKLLELVRIETRRDVDFRIEVVPLVSLFAEMVGAPGG
jgi:hypothetical protein